MRLKQKGQEESMAEAEVADSPLPVLLITLPISQGTLELNPSEQEEKSFQ